MAKMSQYTPLDANDKEYFFGEGEGAVVTVGKTSASSGKVNRLVKLSDIGGDDGASVPKPTSEDVGKVLKVENADSLVWDIVSQPDYGNGLSHDSNTLSVKAGNGIDVDSGGVSVKAGNGIDVDSGGVSVKAGKGIVVDSGAVSVKTQDATAGDVLTFTGEDIVWQAPSGGGGLPDLSKLIEKTAGWKDSKESKDITLCCDITADGSGNITTADNLRWKVELSSGSFYYWNVN